MRTAALALCAGLALGACSRTAGEPSALFEPAARPLAARGMDPSLHVASSGRILALAAEPRDDGTHGLVLRSSEDGGDFFHELHRLDGGGDVESHGEGRPLLRVGPRHEHYVVWSERGAGGGKRLWLARSLDFLHSFAAATPIAAAGAATFFDLAVAPDGVLVLAWLGYEPVPGARPGTASIRIARSTDQGATWSEPTLAAKDVCPCCRPRLALTSAAAFLVWRGVADADVRDVWLARSTDAFAGEASPVRVADDGWKIDGCPHSGASLAVDRERLWVAWATGASGTMRAFVASTPLDTLELGPARALGADLRDANHPELAITKKGVWVAFQARPTAEDGEMPVTRAWVARVDEARPPVAVASPVGAGSALYPAITGLEVDKLFVAWTDSLAAGTAILVARARIP